MVDAVPSSPKVYLSTLKKDTRAASKDIIQEDLADTPIDRMTDLLFEDIGGQEIINMSRHDTINGQNIVYSPIANIASISRQYNSQNILPVQQSIDNMFKSFVVKFENYVPEVEYLYDEDGNLVYDVDGNVLFVDGSAIYVQLDETNPEIKAGDLVINLINIPDNEQVEVQVLKSGKTLML